jgi:hypothetical protein
VGVKLVPRSSSIARIHQRSRPTLCQTVPNSGYVATMNRGIRCHAPGHGQCSLGPGYTPAWIYGVDVTGGKLMSNLEHKVVVENCVIGHY